MEEIINIQNLSFSFENKKLFDNLNVKIMENRWLTIVGPNGSGKSTIAKIICGNYNYEGQVEVKTKRIGIVYSGFDLQSMLDTVDEELNTYKKKLDLSEEEFNKKKDKIVSFLNLKNYVNSKTNELSYSHKVLVSLASNLIYEPKILILDGTLDILDSVQREKVIKILKRMQKRGTTIINITQDIENSLLGDDIMLISDGEVKIYKAKEKFFNNEKELKKYGIKLPFIVDLSLKLKYYNMIDKIYLNMEELVDAIWK